MKIQNTIRFILFIFFLNLIITLAMNANSKSRANDEVISGEKFFKTNCSGCHINGQNLIKPNKPIIGSQKLKSKNSFARFIESPPPPMPSFKNITSKQEQFTALYNYVTSLKAK